MQKAIGLDAFSQGKSLDINAWFEWFYPKYNDWKAGGAAITTEELMAKYSTLFV